MRERNVEHFFKRECFRLRVKFFAAVPAKRFPLRVARKASYAQAALARRARGIAPRVVVRNANDAGARIDEVRRLAVVEAFRIVEKNDGFVPAEIFRRTRVEHGNRFAKRELPDLLRAEIRGNVRTQARGFDCTGGGKNFVRDDDASVIKLRSARATVFDDDFFHAATQFANAARLRKFFVEQTKNLAHADVRTRETFAENTAPHDGELRERHVVRNRAAVKRQRNEKRIDEPRFAEKFSDAFPRGNVFRVERGFVEIFQKIIELAEAVDFPRERARDLAFEQGKIVGETDFFAERVNCGFALRAQIELFAANAKLAQQLCQRRVFRSRGNVIRHRVQADIVAAPVNRVKTVEPAERIMPIDEQHFFSEMRKADSRREPAHAGADDERVDVRFA